MQRVTKHRTGYLFKRGKFYYLEYMVDGKRVKRALKDEEGNSITDKKAAETRRDEIMSPLKLVTREKALRAITHQLDETAKEREETEAGQNGGLSFGEAWKSFVASHNRPDSGDRTLRGYQQQFSQFAAWMAERYPDLIHLRDVTQAIADEYADFLLTEQKDKDGTVVRRAYTSNTYNKHVRLLELVYRVLQEKAGITKNPWAAITRRKEQKQSRRELTVKEINTIVNSADGELQRLLLLGIYTGLRLGDCCSLRWSEIDIDRQLILRVPNKTARRKSNPVHIPTHPTLLAALTNTPQHARKGYVLPSFAAQYQDNDSEVSKVLRNHFKKCGIQIHREGTGFRREKVSKRREKSVHTGARAVVEVGFHSLRHSFVSLCRQANTPLAVVEAIVGHSNPAMTRHYTHVGDVAASQAVAALPAINGETEKEEEAASRSKHLSPRDREMLQILESSTKKTWAQDRSRLLELLIATAP